VKIKSLRYDKDVKPFWKRLMDVSSILLSLFLILNAIIRMYARSHFVSKDLLDFIRWILLLVMVLYMLPKIVYFIKPSLFKLNKE